MKTAQQPDSSTLFKRLLVELLKLRGERGDLIRANEQKRTTERQLKIYNTQNEIDVLHFNLGRLYYLINNFTKLKALQVDIVERNCRALIHNYMYCLQAAEDLNDALASTAQLPRFLQGPCPLKQQYLSDLSKAENFKTEQTSIILAITDPLDLMQYSQSFTAIFTEEFNISIEKSSVIKMLHDQLINSITPTQQLGHQ